MQTREVIGNVEWILEVIGNVEQEGSSVQDCIMAKLVRASD